MELLVDGYRTDGRKPSEIRKISCRLAPFQQADGSAYISQGGTKVLAAVYGPREPKEINAQSEQDGECVLCDEHIPHGAGNGVCWCFLTLLVEEFGPRN